MYWENELETLNRIDLEKLQVKRLKQTIQSAMNSQYYKDLYRQLGLSADSVNSVGDLQKLPFTNKQNLRDNFPYGFLGLPQRDLIRLHSTSGTTGNPTVIFHNRHDIDSWANLMARSLYCAGIRDTDVFQNICGYGLFTGGLGFQYGIERLGCLSIPAGAGNSPRQIKLMRDYGTTVAHAIPSYLSRLYEVFQEEGLDPRKDTKLRTFVIGAEPHTEEQRRRIEEMFGVKAYNSFGLTEMNGPGVAFECTFQNGLHIWEDSYLVEIINPDTLEPVADGEIGELVMTTLDRQAMPLIRYRTRDVTTLVSEQCACGRTLRRIRRIGRRSDDMFIIRGVNVFPSQVETALLRVEGTLPHYQIILTREVGLDQMEVQVEVTPEVFSDEIRKLETLQQQLGASIENVLGIRVKVTLVGPRSLARSEGKAKRVTDLRNV